LTPHWNGKKSIFAAAVFSLLFCAAPVEGAIVYQVTVNTLAVNGQSGHLNFQFNPGFDSQAASAAVSGFSITGGMSSGAPTLTGDVTGTLPGTVTFNNSTAFNDYFHPFDFGTSMQFTLTIYGPAVDAPNGTSASGSTFGIGLWDAAGTSPILTTDPNGFAATVDLLLNGTAAITLYPESGTDPSVVSFSEVPEPATYAGVGTMLCALAYLRRRQKNQ
jgi:hypothetical protein